MKIIFRFIVVCILVFSCNSSDDNLELKAFCSVENPTKNLTWLRNEIEQREQNISDDSKYFYISQTIYKEETIIIYANCHPLIDSVFPVLNCEGENIGYVGDENFPFGFDFVNEGQIIWKTNNFACEF